MIKKLIIFAVIGISLSGCIGIGDDGNMPEPQKAKLRDDTIRERASREMSCPADKLQLKRNDSLIKKDAVVYPYGYANLPYEVYGCGSERTYLLRCDIERKLEPFINDTVSIFTLGAIEPIRIKCKAEPFSVTDTANAQTNPEDHRR